VKDVQHQSFDFRARFSEPEGDRRGPGNRPRRQGRWSAKRKASVVLELLRGADLESTSRKYGVTAATLTEWRDAFLAAGAEGLEIRQEDLVDEQGRRQKRDIAGLAMENEFLRERIRRMEDENPFLRWRSRR
jgi:Transposase.